MVGIVIVSHSRALAEALVALIRQVASPEVPLAIAAGAGPDRLDFGTDAMEIAAAVQSIYSQDGVVILMDLGSAVLSAEMALELLPEEMRRRVVCCPGPLVEGAIVAGVQAGLGNDLQTVCQEARQALAPKIVQLREAPGVGQGEGSPPVAGLAEQPDQGQSVEVTLSNPHGLHARPAARFVQLAASFDAQVEVMNLTTGKGPVSACSLNALATLGARGGHQISIRAQGAQAAAVLNALGLLVESGFSEAGSETLPAVETSLAVHLFPGKPVQGIPLSEGIAIGPLLVYRPLQPAVPQTTVDDPAGEWRRLAAALEAVQRSIASRQERLRAQLSPNQVSIFDAHRLILQDPELLARTTARIEVNRMNAAAAWQASITETARAYLELDDAYQQARHVDVLDVGDQVLRVLLGKEEGETIHLSKPAILFAEELSPGETASLEPGLALGLVTASGGPTSHSAILARALGLPALAGVDLPRLGVLDGTQIALDGASGLVWIEPAEGTLQELAGRHQTWLAARSALLEDSHAPAQTLDGRHIELAANAGSLATARAALPNGAQGIGVLRTEFLYLDRDSPPSEEEQVSVLREIGRILEKQPVIVRTLDVGGDKALRYVPMPQESNPYLGVRGLRLSLRQPVLFLTQLRAILRTGMDYPLKVMFPMVTSLDEVLQARVLLEQAHHSLEMEGLAHRWPVETGIMIEVPAAAVISPRLAAYIDFFSVGTNDLTQYALAAERGNRDLTDLADALHPAILRLIKLVTEAAHQHGKWAGVCGEVAGDPQAVPILVGLGVDELSMNPAEIPAVKRAIRGLNFEKAQAVAEQALACESAAQVRALVR